MEVSGAASTDTFEGIGNGLRGHFLPDASSNGPKVYIYVLILCSEPQVLLTKVAMQASSTP